MPREQVTSYLNRRIERLEQRLARLEQTVSNTQGQLDQDVQNLTQADTTAEARVSAEVANLQSELDALKAGGTVDPAALAGIEAVTARLQALAPAQTPTPAP